MCSAMLSLTNTDLYTIWNFRLSVFVIAMIFLNSHHISAIDNIPKSTFHRTPFPPSNGDPEPVSEVSLIIIKVTSSMATYAQLLNLFSTIQRHMSKVLLCSGAPNVFKSIPQVFEGSFRGMNSHKEVKRVKEKDRHRIDLPKVFPPIHHKKDHVVTRPMNGST
jgi:hypothetical protein